MKPAEFDQFADEYYEQHRTNIAITGESPEFFAEYKVKILSQLAAARSPEPNRILDFGSGIGNSIAYFHQHMPGSQLSCADVSRRSLELAQQRFPDLAHQIVIGDRRIPADDGTFDILFSACVFHHIPHDEHIDWLRELLRVARPGALLVVFEHNPLNPLTVRAVNTCAFDENARLLSARSLKARYRRAGWHQPRARYHLFFPHALAALRPLETYLSRIPFGAQYSVAATKPG
ncbi:MAG: methyltransferase domain-containing protein [Pseudoxanthomonas sp.]